MNLVIWTTASICYNFHNHCPIMLTDTHCHLDLNKFDEDRAAVIQRALDSGITRILIPALDYESSMAGIKLAASHPNIFAAVGFHPTDLDKWNENSINELKSIITTTNVTLSDSEGSLTLKSEILRSAQNDMVNKIVAIGEIGLDY